MLVTREGRYPEEEKQVLIEGPTHFRYSGQLVKEVAQFLCPGKSPHIVDLGAGIGSLSYDFSNVLPNARITAIENCVPSHRPHPITRNLEARGKYRYHQGEAEETGLNPMSVDLIICGQAFSYMRMQDTLTEAKRILRTGSGAALFFIHGADRACTGLEEFVFELDLPPPPTPFMDKFWKLIKQFYMFTPLRRRELHSIDMHDCDTTAYKETMRTIPVMRTFFVDESCIIKTVCELWGKYNFVELCQLARWTEAEEDLPPEQQDSPEWQKFYMKRDETVQNKLKELFDEHNVEGRVDFYHYVTVFYGLVTRPAFSGLKDSDFTLFDDTTTTTT